MMPIVKNKNDNNTNKNNNREHVDTDLVDKST